MTARTLRRTLVVAALTAAAGVTSGPAVTSGAAVTSSPLICYFREVPGGGNLFCCVPQTPLSQGNCAVNVGTCAGGCTVNVGYCAPTGSCLINTGACGDGSLLGLPARVMLVSSVPKPLS